MLKQLTQQDAGFLYLETIETPAHVGGLDLVELPEGYRDNYFEAYKRMIESRAHLVPFLQSKLVQVPLQLDLPFWVADDHFDIDFHVRRAAVPSPGGLEQLEELVAQLHSNLLDLTRPLWEFYVIEGLASGQIALYIKVHHAAMDGVSSQALLQTMYDPSPKLRVLPGPRRGRPLVRASARNLAKGVLAHVLRQGIRAVQTVPELLKLWTRLVLPNAETLRYERFVRRPHTPATLFNVGITNQRVYAARTLALRELKQVSRQTGTTVNDVVLAVCSGALRSYLEAKQALPAQSLTVMVPIAVRETADAMTANQNGAYVCSLASDVEAPYERLLAIHRSSAEQRRRFDVFGKIPLPDVPLIGGSLLARPLVQLYGHSALADRAPLFANLTISNVRGPDNELYVAGGKLVSLYPCSIPFHRSALNITAQSYVDRLDFGLVACRTAVPDLAQLADGLAVAFAELKHAVEHRRATAHAAPSPAAPDEPARGPAPEPRAAAPRTTAPN